MGNLLSSLITDEMRIALIVVVVMIAALYVLSIIWVVRDAYQRGAKWPVWGVIAIIPLVGLVAYCLLRPSLMQIDREEQELEIAYKQRALSKYGQCAHCGYPVEDDYVVCPNCRAQLKNKCTHCGKPLEHSWSICPYCATLVDSRAANQNQRRRRPAQAPQQAPREEALDGRTVAMDAARQERPARRRRPETE